MNFPNDLSLFQWVRRHESTSKRPPNKSNPGLRSSLGKPGHGHRILHITVRNMLNRGAGEYTHSTQIRTLTESPWTYFGYGTTDVFCCSKAFKVTSAYLMGNPAGATAKIQNWHLSKPQCSPKVFNG